jgi:hypothetical protein
MRAFALALLIATGLAACTMPGAPDDASRLETSAGERAPATDAPRTSGDATGSDAPAASPNPGAAAPSGPEVPPGEAPPMSDPLPPEPAPVAERRAADPSAPDRSCRTSADCVVKDVGNCCGTMPACVNKGARTDPAAVKAQCERQGMASVCGFKEVTACTCVAGTCQDVAGDVAQ